MKLRVQLQEAILVLEHVAPRQQGLLSIDRVLKMTVVLIARIDRQLGHARLEQPPRLEHAGDLVESQVRLRSRRLERNVVGSHEHAAARA